eukprot:TRINITY_DN4194_c2_g1_i1.p2 TRINITY_DN4194_c2_g1~~TRINITY_DN4194_c2_g1_i1.p2  ORF type:complete len:244 (+),score=62.10 TRINITY_DN4194_c2_g1_i1:73-732(+)
MALRLALCGTSTHFKGTEEAYWLLILDCDNNGINRTAKLRTNGDMVNIMFREGMKTYIGVAQKDGSETGPWPCRGMYYHDDDGGPASGCPRGTFNLRVYQLRGEGRTVVFDGSYSDCAVSGQHYSLAVEIRNPEADRTPVGSSVGQWVESESMLKVVNGDRLLVGRWATSMSSVNKWTGVMYAPKPGLDRRPGPEDFDEEGMPVGTFLLFPTELKDDDE